MSLSLSTIFGVVPDEMSAVEAGDRAAGDRDEHEGEQRAGDDRAAAADVLRDSAGTWSSGLTMTTPITSSAIVPIFMNVLR